VLSKLLLVVLATALLVLHQLTAVQEATRFAGASEGFPHLGRLGIQLATDGALAIGVLIATVLIAVYKPRGVTPLGRRVLEGRGQSVRAGRPGRWIFIATLAAIGVVFILVHLGGMSHTAPTV
jgi:hypothetical protein